MQHESDLVYLDRRASEERRAADSSGNRAVRDLHLEFASAYEFRLHLLRQQAARQARRTPLVAEPVTTNPVQRVGSTALQQAEPVMHVGSPMRRNA
jgi:hypothetical protein